MKTIKQLKPSKTLRSLQENGQKFTSFRRRTIEQDKQIMTDADGLTETCVCCLSGNRLRCSLRPFADEPANWCN